MTFAKVHLLVDRVIRPVKDVSDLTIYDAALRIAAYLRKLPTEVYLHNGAAEGYSHLFQNAPVPKVVPRGQFDDAIGRLHAYQIEDFLCIFKDDFEPDGKPPRSRCHGLVRRHIC